MIGIFDSGVGGLTVVRALKRVRPDLSFVYLGDTARTPYGTKSRETIQRYSEEATRFLASKGAKAVIIACNTASSLATEHLRKTFPKMPFFEVITPAVASALGATKNGQVGIIGTRATIGSGVYERYLKNADEGLGVHSVAAPLLVSLVEEGWTKTPEAAAIVGKYIGPLRNEGIDTLILGCTHYPILKDIIAERMGPEVRLVDSAEAAVKAFCATIEGDATPSGGQASLMSKLDTRGGSSFFVTDMTSNFTDLASEWLGESVTASKIEL